LPGPAVDAQIQDALAKVAEAQKALADACVDRLFRWVLEHGGTITGEHGIGLAKAKWFREAVGEGAFHLHELVKSALDPRNLLNPGKMGLP
jgi:glycolate oxidase